MFKTWRRYDKEDCQQCYNENEQVDNNNYCESEQCEDKVDFEQKKTRTRHQIVRRITRIVDRILMHNNADLINVWVSTGLLSKWDGSEDHKLNRNIICEEKENLINRMNNPKNKIVYSETMTSEERLKYKVPSGKKRKQLGTSKNQLYSDEITKVEKKQPVFLQNIRKEVELYFLESFKKVINMKTIKTFDGTVQPENLMFIPSFYQIYS